MGIIQRQSIKNLFTSYLGIIIGFVNLMIIQPRFLTAEELGLTRILFSSSLVIAMFIPMGIGSATTKYFPLFYNRDEKHHGFLGFLLLFPMIGFAISSVILLLLKNYIISQYIAESKLFTEYFNFIFPLSFIIALISCLNIYCFSLLKSTIPAFLNDVVSRVMILILVPIYFFRMISLVQFISLFVGIYAFQVLLLFIYIFYEETPGFRIDWPFFRKNNLLQILRYGWLMWFAVLASIGLKELGTIVIGKYMKLDYVAVYAIAAFIPTIIEAPLNAMERISTSKIAYAWSENNLEQIRSIYQKSALYMLLLGGLLFLGININIKDLLEFLPQKYHEGYIVVTIISIGTLFNMATGVNTAILFYSDQYRTGAFFLLSLVLISFLLQVLLIPVFGIAGAAIATASSGILFNLANLLFVWKKFRLQPYDKKSMAIVLLILGCFLLNMVLPELSNIYLNILYRSFIITAIYAFVVYRLAVVPEFHQYIPFLKKSS